MDLLLAPDFSSSTASPPSRIPIVLTACKNGSLIAEQKKFLDRFSGLHLQRIRIGQGTAGRIAKNEFSILILSLHSTMVHDKFL
jgi:hypothetical protein